MIKNNNVKIMGLFASVLLLVIIVTASFAYFGSFNVNLNNNVAVNVNSVSPGNATFTSNATQLNLQVPAANMSQTAADNETPATENTATLTVNLTGAANLLTTCTYDIVYEYDTNSNVYGVSPTTKNGDKEVTIQVSGVNGTNNFASEKNFDSNTISSYKNGNVYTLVSGATIESDGTLTTQNISITGKYYNLTISQSSLEGKSFTGKIYVTNNKCETKGEEPMFVTLLNAYGGKNVVESQPDPDFSTEIAEGEKGMFTAKDDLGTSYYYRGTVNNNWVKFGKEGTKDIYWRIIRINGDGSIRMIYSGTTKPSEDRVVTESNGVYMTGTIACINATTYNFNSSYDKAEYVGYQHIEGQQHGFGECNGSSTSCEVNGNTVYNSTIKQEIDKWYAGTSLGTDKAIKELVSQDQIFCNDRSASTSKVAYSESNYTTLTSWNSTGTTYYYGAYGRLVVNKEPILTCPTESDKFTSKDSSIGNKALDYPVGLITADEIAMAGGVYGLSIYDDSKSYYLSLSGTSINYYYTGSPFYHSEGKRGVETYTFDLYVNTLNSTSIAYDEGIRPVISLSASVVLSGDGTYSNPYTVN